MATSEHDKLMACQDERQAIGEFIEWVRGKGWDIAEWDSARRIDHRMMPLQRSIESLLAEYFGVDTIKLEAEKRQMLTELRAAKTQAAMP